MIIRDLEHYKSASQISQIRKVEGGMSFTALLSTQEDFLAQGTNVYSFRRFDTIVEEGQQTPSGYSPSVVAWSRDILVVASSDSVAIESFAGFL